MLFTSSSFIMLFFPALIILYFLVIPRNKLPAKNFILLLFSIIFYAWGGVKYLTLLLASIVINYVGGILVSSFKSRAVCKLFLAFTVLLNLSLLGVFKYAGLVTSTLSGLGLNVGVIRLALPIGISFYTFQGLSYVVDVYRGETTVQKNPLYVALYISLFPQLVAGPIVRYTDIEAQIYDREHSINNFGAGVTRFMLGFGKKMLMANAMGEIADKIFPKTGTELLTTPVAWVGAIAYSFQIYFDFSAYSDMAIGLGRMFGFTFNENFNYPYISTSVTEFWRRWHISLSTWFRDYVYIPLGGNRRSIGRNIFNLSVVWALTGLWHGAAWNFVLWGVYYGILLILEKYVFAGVMKKIPRALGHIITLLIIIVGWVIFRSANIADAGSYIRAMFGMGSHGTEMAVYFLRQYYPEFIICIIGSFPIKKAIENFVERRDENNTIFALSRILSALFAIATFVLSYIKLVSGSFNPFIYFQF